MSLSPRAAAAILDVSPRRVQEFIRDGRIAAENIGTAARPRYVIQEQELERFAALTRPQGRPRKEFGICECKQSTGPTTSSGLRQTRTL